MATSSGLDAMIDVDVHAHLAPVNAARLATLPGVQWEQASESLMLDGHRIGMKALFHPERLIARMDAHGIRKSLISIPPPLYRQSLDAAAALVWTRYVNEEMSSIAAAHPGRFGALFYLPLENISLLETLRQDFIQGQFEGFALAAGGHPDIIYSSPDYADLWEWLQRERAFTFLHPGTCADTRLAKFYLENLVGNPVETGVAASHLVMAGIPARYPDIRFCLAHAGGIFGSLIGRLQRGFDTNRPNVNATFEGPVNAARRFYVDCIAHSPEALEHAKKIFGDSHVLYGSDWPFPMGLNH